MWAFEILFACLLVFGALYFFYENWPRTPAQEYRHQFNKWQDDCWRRGLTPQQQVQELQFRHAWARLRRRATEEALKSPAEHNEKIAEIAKDEAMTLALTDKDVAKRFLKVVDTSPLHDILYPDAMKAVEEEWQRQRLLGLGRSGMINEDMIAAVRTCRWQRQYSWPPR